MATTPANPIQSGRPPITRVDDVREDWRVSEYFRLSEGRSLLIVPLVVRDRPIGIIGGSSACVGAFTEEDERLLELERSGHHVGGVGGADASGGPPFRRHRPAGRHRNPRLLDCGLSH
jgi:hypothetical protein